MRFLAVLRDHDVIGPILLHQGLPYEAPRATLARDPLLTRGEDGGADAGAVETHDGARQAVYAEGAAGVVGFVQRARCARRRERAGSPQGVGALSPVRVPWEGACTNSSTARRPLRHRQGVVGAARCTVRTRRPVS